jgi:hypothetical protein
MLLVYVYRQDQQKYTVLLVLTDGVINDMDESITAIINVNIIHCLCLFIRVILNFVMHLLGFSSTHVNHHHWCWKCRFH